MHPANDYYGHNVILGWAASMQRPPRTLGYVQHGWKPESGFPTTMRLLPRAPLYVWSEANRTATADRWPGHPVHAVGAPFVYLWELLKGSVVDAPSRDLLVYPCHQLRETPLDRAVHESLIEQVRELAPSSVTVNLHSYEFKDGHTRQLYEADLPGAVVTTNWLLPPRAMRNDPTILVRQLLQILDHRRVVSNCLTTALLYAGYLQRDARLLRHPARRDPPTEGRGRALHEELERATDGGPLQAIAGTELGADQLRPPDELRALMGWDSKPRTVAASVIRRAHELRRSRQLA